MSISVSVPSIMNESSSDGCGGAFGASFCNGGTARRLHCISTVACFGGFSISVAACSIHKIMQIGHHNVISSYITFVLAFTRTVTETDFILGLLACVDASCQSGKADGPSSWS